MQDQTSDNPSPGGTPSAPRIATLTASPEFRTGNPVSLVKDPKRLLRPAKVFVLLTLAMAFVAIGSDLLELQFFSKLEAGAFESDGAMLAAAESNDLRQLIIGVAYLAVLVLAFIFVGRWIYFSSKNLRAFGATGLRIRPGWAVGWYFIPIANLWKPYQAMKEIWQASSEPLDWGRQRTPGLMPAWWALWLISNVADRIAFRLASNAEMLDEFKFATAFGLGSGILNVVLCIVFVTLISRIARLQVYAMDHKSTVAVF